MPSVPVPHDLPLPLPLAPATAGVAIVVLFLLHILFVNLMVGGALLTVAFELAGRRDRAFDELAREIAATVTVNKSLAVVLGVGPLLVMNVLYTLYFYSANALTGSAWIMIVPLVTAAFLASYAHKYSWDRLADAKGLHLAIGMIAALLFLVVPLIFLANINLMLFPERWPTVHGFLTALALPNVLPRYLHFVVASLAITGVFLAGYFGRAGYPVEERLPGFSRASLRRRFLSLAFGATAAQLVVGPLVLFTLPASGMSWHMLANVLAGLLLALGVLWVLWREVVVPAASLDRRYAVVVVLLTGTATFMVSGRHLYREAALAAHRGLVAAATEDFAAEVLAAQMRAAAGTPRLAEEKAASPGERVFKSVCMGCHARTTRLVGPPLVEIASLYRGNPDGLMSWVKKPGRRRPDYPEMPPVVLAEAQYRAVADYILSTP